MISPSSVSEIQSILTNISSEIWGLDNINESKKIINEYINESYIEDSDKILIINNLNKIESKYDLDKYISNSILFFEGHSLNNEPTKPKPKKNTQYFTKETEKAIVEYNNTEDPEKRSEIYREKIHYAFFKLTENIIHTFKFYYTEVENIEDLQHEIITFLLSKIHLFNPEKGAKAYSYFGTITKRWLILYNQKNYQKKLDTIDIDLLEEDEHNSYELEESQPVEKLSYYIDEFTQYCTNNIYVLFPKHDDSQIADAILELFRKREYLDIFNKKALYMHIREIVDAKTPKITKISSQLYKIFKKGYTFYLENGYIKF